MRNRFQRSTYMTVRNDTVVTSFNKRPSDGLVFADVCNVLRIKQEEASSNLTFSQTVVEEYIPAPVIRTYQVGKQTITMSDNKTFQTGHIYVNETL